MLQPTPPMAATKIRPLTAAFHSSPPPASSDPSDSQRSSVYTVWMKSLVFNGHGCTIYGPDGRVAYRVDNYADRRSRKVYVMDTDGKTLIKILKKRLEDSFWLTRGSSRGILLVSSSEKKYGGEIGAFGSADSSKSHKDDYEEDIRPWFKVQKCHEILRKNCESNRAIAIIAGSGSTYRIVGHAHKSEYKITDTDGGVVAEIKRKQTPTGVVLGDDVLRLEVGPAADHLLIIGLVVACGLINRCI